MIDYFEIPQAIARRMTVANQNALKRIGEDIAKIGSLNNYKDAQLIAVRMTGESVKDITNELSKASGMTVEDIEKLFDDAARYDYEFAEQFYSAKDKEQIPYRDNKQLQRLVKSMTTAAQESCCYNLSHSYAFALRDSDGRIRYTSLRAGYKEAIDKAVTAIATGVSDYKSEMRRVLKQYADSGVRIVDWESGYSQRIDTAVRRNIMDSLRQLKNESQELIGQEFGANGYEISAHANPAPDHADIQGRQYSFDDFNALNESLERKLGTLNCYHTKTAIILGISVPAYTEEQLQEMKRKSNELIEIDGKKYSRYDCTQLQRQIETKIRKLKDRRELLKAAGDDVGVRECDRKIRLLKDKYNEITQKAGLNAHYDRMSIAKSVFPVAKDEKSIDNKLENDIIQLKKKETTVGNVHSIGKIDIEKYKCVTEDITTDEVIITDTQIAHIKEHHPNDYERYFSYIEEIVKNPDYILEANKPNTAFVLKHIEDNGKNYQIILRLKTSVDPKDYKNSVITFLKVGDKRYERYLRTKKILYKNE